MRMKIFFICFIIVLGLISGCKSPNDIVSPMHYDRVPRPTWNTNFTADTSATGKLRIYLSWNVSSLKNIKNFDLYRTTDSTASLSKYSQVGSSTTTSIIDSFSVSLKDTMNFYYYLIPNGNDRFIGQYSDVLKVIVIKNKLL